MSVRLKLLIVFLVLSVATLAVCRFAYLNAAQTLITRSIFDHLTTTAEIQANRVSSLIKQNQDRLKLLTSRTQLRLSLKSYLDTGNTSELERMTRTIRDASASIKDFEAIHVSSLEGIILASTNQATLGTSIREAAYFQDARKSEVVQNATVKGAPKLILAGPLVLENTEIGVLVVQATTAPINQIADDYSGLGATGETIVIVNSSGTPSAISRMRFRPRSSQALLTVNSKKESIDSEAPLAAVDYRAARVLAVTRAVPNSDWSLVVKIDEEEAFSPLKELRYLVLTFLLAALLVSGFSAVVVSRILTKPIVDLTNVALAISRGNLKKRITTFTQDEFGRLAKAFNHMADRLIETNTTLERKVDEKTKELLQANAKLLETNARLRELSSKDSLTKIANRRMFDETLSTEWLRNRRQRSDLSLILIDIDLFKRFNDHTGHQAGDACLRHVAAIIKNCLRRAGDLAARYGGEEFAALLPNTDPDGALECARRIQSAIIGSQIEHPDSDVSPYVTVSVGVATIVPSADFTPEELVAAADQALYKAKERGRNRVERATVKLSATQTKPALPVAS